MIMLHSFPHSLHSLYLQETILLICIYITRDMNDNAPFLPSFPPFTIPPGDNRRVIVNLNATDVG